MIRYAKRKTSINVRLSRLTDWRLPYYRYIQRVDVLSRGQSPAKKTGETKTKPPRTPRSAF